MASELRLLHLWEEFLGEGSVQSELADFFKLGGHSMLVSKLISKVRLWGNAYSYISAKDLYVKGGER